MDSSPQASQDAVPGCGRKAGGPHPHQVWLLGNQSMRRGHVDPSAVCGSGARLLFLQLSQDGRRTSVRVTAIRDSLCVFGPTLGQEGSNFLNQKQQKCHLLSATCQVT